MGRMFFRMLSVVFFISLWATSAWCLVTSPALDEQVPAGSAYVIEWEAIPGATAYNVFVSYDNKATWEKINGTDKVPATTYDWTVKPLTKTRNSCFVRVMGFNDAGTKMGNVLSSVFTVGVLDITAPGPGEIIDAGSLYEVTWDTTTQVAVTGAILSYSIDGGGTWKPLATLESNPGAYIWTVPQLTATSKQCKVRVILTDDLGDAVARAITPLFTIKVTKVTLASLNAESYAISFTVDGPRDGPNTAGIDFISATWNGAGHLDVHIEDTSDPPPDADDQVAYSVAADGQVSITEPGTSIHGIASKDAGLVILQDTNNGDNWIESILMIKKSSGLDNSVLDGIYVMGEFGQEADGTKYAGLYQITFMGDGNGATHCLEDSRGCLPDMDFTYSVQPDGKVETSLFHKGVVDSTGNVLATGILGAGGGIVSIGFGLRQPTSMFTESTLAGKFISGSLGYTSSNTRFNTCVAKLRMDGAGIISITDIYLSSPPPESGEGTYEVFEDEHGLTLLHIGDWVEGYTGAISRDGQVFFVVDTTTGEFDDELGLTVGLKKTK